MSASDALIAVLRDERCRGHQRRKSRQGQSALGQKDVEENDQHAMMFDERNDVRIAYSLWPSSASAAALVWPWQRVVIDHPGDPPAERADPAHRPYNTRGTEVRTTSLPTCRRNKRPLPERLAHFS